MSMPPKRHGQRHYQMYDYVTRELPALVEANLPLTDARAITGHSMGGHGALICALKEPGRYRSVSAFAPICHPMACGWGQGCFKALIWARTGKRGPLTTPPA
jgi:S-formylglutathione hydrolase